jgi:hypothetical protein
MYMAAQLPNHSINQSIGESRWSHEVGHIQKVLTPISYILLGNLYKVHHIHEEVMPSIVVQNSRVRNECCLNDAFLFAFVLRGILLGYIFVLR